MLQGLFLGIVNFQTGNTGLYIKMCDVSGAVSPTGSDYGTP